MSGIRLLLLLNYAFGRDEERRAKGALCGLQHVHTPSPDGQTRFISAFG